MIYVVESYKLKPEYNRKATEVMQELDEILGPGAHSHEGWIGHAQFLQNQLHRNQILVIYPWKSAELLHDLLHEEEKYLRNFYENYCLKPREVSILQSLPVDVD